MKAIFIAYDQAHHEHIIEILNHLSCRGFTAFGDVQGRGSKTGTPHYGTHAWPSLVQAMLVFADDDKEQPLLGKLREIDREKPLLGLRAFVWDVNNTI